jgi:putative transposase
LNAPAQFDPSGNDTAANSLPGGHARRAEEKSPRNGSKASPPDYRGFYWQRGYGAFSVSPSVLDTLLEYVDTQEEHHRSRTFQEEYREFLRKHGVEYDERFVWD